MHLRPTPANIRPLCRDPPALGDSILRSLVCSTGQAWWRDVSGSSGQDVYAVGFIDAGTSLKGKFSLATRARLFSEGVTL
ncbi:MAG TPA: hypothetical protein VMS62_06900 [Gemmatimonadales bacterium]|nr:hypothetical protein [Gemmatimonadales bacterium]